MIKLIAGIIVFTLFITLSAMYSYGTKETMTCNVKNKERVFTKDRSKYIIFCENEVLEDTDTLWYLKFNSSDVYNDLDIGKEYKLDVYGWRIPVLSAYRNIIRINR